jgi:hypothetical protein
MLKVVVYAKALVRVGEMALSSNESRRPVLCEKLVFDTEGQKPRGMSGIYILRFGDVGRFHETCKR